MDKDGNVKHSWEDLAKLTTDYFSKTLGDAPDEQVQVIDQGLLNEVLAVQSDKVSVAEKEELNAPISLEELGDSVMDLANGKCPDRMALPLNSLRRIGRRWGLWYMPVLSNP